MEYLRALDNALIISLILSAIIGLICLAGIIFALIRWKRHRAVSIITIIALLLTAASPMILTVSRFYVIQTQTSRILERGGEDRFMEMSLTYYRTFSLFFIAATAIQIFLLIFFLIAIFLGRAKAEQKEQPNTFQKIENSH